MLAERFPGRHLTLEGQDHSVLQHPELRPALVEFFS
jgi:hypothetical protein